MKRPISLSLGRLNRLAACLGLRVICCEGGGGESHIKVTGVVVRNFEKIIKKNILKRFHDPVLWVWPPIFIIPKRYQF